MKLSACLVIRNEEKVLARCLESIKDIVDEIILIHDGLCCDRSLEIAKKYKAKIFIREYIGEAEYHRPYSFSQAKGEWILQIDADEFLEEKAKELIKKIIKNKIVDAYSFSWPYHDGKRYLKKGPFAKTFKPCLFRKEKMFMIGISHEFPRTFGKMIKLENLKLEHIPPKSHYTLSAFSNKWIKWAKLQAKQICEIEKAPVFNIKNLKNNKIFQSYLWMRKYPLLSALKETGKFIILYLARGLLWSGLTSFKIAAFEISYIWMVRIYLLFGKYE